ncbi:MAG: crossover junction endodeoxyribonuclease RuvC [Candidatus Bipolaricaulota bacterium]|nr:crossover junction endodeoxyribonuclease RuvC [Candidatus Bipolaricaulota bacterium]
MSESEIILGIDPGLATCGYGVVSAAARRSFDLVENGAIRTSSDSPLSSRLAKIHSSVVDLVDRYEPNRVAVERIFFSNNQKTAVLVAQARGVILLAATDREVASYSPLEIKKTITGYGQANKEQLQIMVKRLLSLREIPKPADAADAIGVALCCGLDKKSAINQQLNR